jgi:hypothetical protein
LHDVITQSLAFGRPAGRIAYGASSAANLHAIVTAGRALRHTNKGNGAMAMELEVQQSDQRDQIPKMQRLRRWVHAQVHGPRRVQVRVNMATAFDLESASFGSKFARAPRHVG